MLMGKFDWKDIVRTVAPSLATALGGPLAGTAVKLLGDKLLGKPNASESELASAIAGATPEQLLKLREVEGEFLKFMETAGIERERIAADDRDSARKRQVATSDKTPQVLAVLVLAAWVAIQFFLFSGDVPDGNRDLIARALGTLDVLLGTAFAYFLGSSAGSRAKDSALAGMAARR
jgi:hypothetical protein